jgi:muramoyltetrapeptide carboxypeptidase
MVVPPKLEPGDEIRVLALSRSLGGVLGQGGLSEEDAAFAIERLESLGLDVSFGRHVYECNDHLTATPSHRADDFHDAVEDPSVKAILSVTGGIGASQLLELLDYGLIASHPKALCGYSDITLLWNAIGRRSELVTYYGPNFTSFMMRKGFDYTLEAFRSCLFGHDGFELTPSEMWSDDAWANDQEDREFLPNDGFWAIQEGHAVGRIVGGTHFGLNLLQGSPYFPCLKDAILFIEMPASGKATLMDLDSALRMLALQQGFDSVKGLVLGRYARQGRITQKNLAALLAEIPQMQYLPVMANVDFGHTTPCATIPLGGRCRIQVEQESPLVQICRNDPPKPLSLSNRSVFHGT